MLLESITNGGNKLWESEYANGVSTNGISGQMKSQMSVLNVSLLIGTNRGKRESQMLTKLHLDIIKRAARKAKEEPAEESAPLLPETLASPDKTKCQLLARLAEKRELLVKPAKCERCHKKTTALDKHHADYTKPLAIEWLCRRCHYRATLKHYDELGLVRHWEKKR